MDSEDASSLDWTVNTEEGDAQPPVQSKHSGPKPIFTHFTPEVRERFQEKVDRTGGPKACWPWTGSCTAGGYGRFHVSAAIGERPAHRTAWVIANECEVPPGLEINHKCENRQCVNPIHLDAISHKHNMDFVESGPCQEHGVECQKKDSRGRVFCASCFGERVWRHLLRGQVDPLPTDKGVMFLEWAWRRFTERSGRVAEPPAPAQRGGLQLFLDSLGEQAALLALHHVFYEWQAFRPYAAKEYGVYQGDADKIAARPLLGFVVKRTEPVMNFWIETDPIEILIQDNAPPRQIAKALIKRFSSQAHTRLPPIDSFADYYDPRDPDTWDHDPGSVDDWAWSLCRRPYLTKACACRTCKPRPARP